MCECECILRAEMVAHVRQQQGSAAQLKCTQECICVLDTASSPYDNDNDVDGGGIKVGIVAVASRGRQRSDVNKYFV